MTVHSESKTFEFPQNQRVALVHDWLTGYRGGEKVLEVLCEIFPNAPLYTLVHKKGSVPSSIEDRTIKTSFIQTMPFGIEKYRHYLPLFPLAAETLIDKDYDFIISTSHAVAKSINTKGAKHWCYIHSPMRYVWDRFDDYFGPTRVGSFASQFFFKPVAKSLAYYDLKTSPRVDHFVANSHFVKERIERFYHRKAEVINPPCDIERFKNIKREPKDYYLFFSALVPYKRCDLAIQACQELNKKLVIIGDGPELKSLKKMANSELIQFLERVPDSVLFEHFSKARAFLFPAVEDFGIAPVESIAAGLPVIGLRSGGLLDSQTDKTCHFFEEQNVESLKRAILSFEANHTLYNTETLKTHAQNFSKEIFRSKITQSLKNFGLKI